MTFRFKKMAGIGLALASALALGGCYDDGYGYSGVSVGYGSGGYYGYDDPWYRGYGPNYGWYDGFYYPGHGYWLYDRNGHRHRWSDRHRRYWEGRRHEWRDRDRDRDRDHAGNWRGRDRDGDWRGRDNRPRDGEWRGRDNRPIDWGKFRRNREEMSNRPASPSGEGRGWRGRGGDSAREGRGERQAPGPMGHIFDRRSRDR